MDAKDLNNIFFYLILTLMFIYLNIFILLYIILKNEQISPSKDGLRAQAVYDLAEQYSKFARDSPNIQTQNSNTQKIENSNPNLNLWVSLGAYVRVDFRTSNIIPSHKRIPILTNIISTLLSSLADSTTATTTIQPFIQKHPTAATWRRPLKVPEDQTRC